MNENIELLIKLCQENPKMEIVSFVNNEVVCGDDYAYWKGEIEKVEKNYYYQNKDEEGITIGKNEIIEKREEELDYQGCKEIESTAEDDFQNLIKSERAKEAIIIYIGI